MIRLSTIKAMSIFCVVAFVTGVLHTPYADSMVLCIGDDGHIDLETARDGDCSSVKTPERPNSSEEIQHEQLTANEYERDHCGECYDVPICDHEDVSVVTTRFVNQDDLALPATSYNRSEFDRVSMTQRLSAFKSIPLSSFCLVSLRSVSLQR